MKLFSIFGLSNFLNANELYLEPGLQIELVPKMFTSKKSDILVEDDGTFKNPFRKLADRFDFTFGDGQITKNNQVWTL